MGVKDCAIYLIGKKISDDELDIYFKDVFELNERLNHWTGERNTKASDFFKTLEHTELAVRVGPWVDCVNGEIFQIGGIGYIVFADEDHDLVLDWGFKPSGSSPLHKDLQKLSRVEILEKMQEMQDGK